MKARGQTYRQAADSLLRDISMYRALTKKQILGLYPGKEHTIRKLLDYMTGQARVFYENGVYFSGQDRPKNIDWGLMAAVWIIVDFIERVEFHCAGEFPVKAIFSADGEVYEVIHIERGKETMISNILAAAGGTPSHRLVMVDDPEQINGLDIPNACGYCTVSPNGEVQYYQKE